MEKESSTTVHLTLSTTGCRIFGSWATCKTWSHFARLSIFQERKKKKEADLWRAVFSQDHSVTIATMMGSRFIHGYLVADQWWWLAELFYRGQAGVPVPEQPHLQAVQLPQRLQPVASFDIGWRLRHSREGWAVGEEDQSGALSF